MGPPADFKQNHKMCPEFSPSPLPPRPLTLLTSPLLQVGYQNSAGNTGRLLGDAALKYRLLQARGFLVVPISCKVSFDLIWSRE